MGLYYETGTDTATDSALPHAPAAGALAERLAALEQTLWRDAIVATARTQQGFLLPPTALSAPLAQANLGAGSVGAVQIQNAAVGASALGVTAGVTAANLATVPDGNKRLDTLVLGTLALGAGAGTAVTSSAPELNTLAGVVAGTTSASKAVVVDAAKKVDTLGTTGAFSAGGALTHTGTTLGVLGHAAQAQQTIYNGAITDNTADASKTAATFGDYTPNTYGTDAATIKTLLAQYGYAIERLYNLVARGFGFAL